MNPISVIFRNSAPFLIFLSIAAFLFACQKPSDETATDEPETAIPGTVDAPAADSAAITIEELNRLRREIQTHQQTVSDLQAAVEMEQAKLEENPEYDQSFLMEVLHEQQEARETIKEHRKRLEELGK